ncbi:hypothetical protein [Microbacterium sp.]|uniref:hypothetical protein n=1 Tax=Microbacterium sp. TaxID=51671 RepID=UPI00333EA962
MDAEDTSINGRVARVEREFAARMQRALILMAVLEGGALLVAGLAIYALDLIEPDRGVFILVGIALLGGMLFSYFVIRFAKQKQQAIEQAKGGSGTVW